ALGVAALWLINGGLELAQRRWMPASYAFDQHVMGLVAGGLSRSETVLLGVSAGVGEELSMRGALQPPLRIVLTAVLFAALHVQYSAFGMLTIALFGAILGVVRRTRGTTTAILVHAAYDVLAATGVQGSST